jgi:hypothetical protein
MEQSNFNFSELSDTEQIEMMRDALRYRKLREHGFDSDFFLIGLNLDEYVDALK